MGYKVEDGEISDSSLIYKIINDLVLDRAEGIIRPVDERKLGVRFTFGEGITQARPSGFLLSSISETGLQRLLAHVHVVIEVFSAEKRITFSCSILQHTPAGLQVSVPKILSRTERRIAQRHKTIDQQTPFFDPKSWPVDSQDIAAPPVFGIYQPLAAWAPVVDISFGGICVETRFPSLLAWLEANPKCSAAQLVFPMMRPIPMHMELRWTKRIRERSQVQDLGYSFQKYKIGLAYVNPPREFMLEVGRYIKELYMSSAV